ncbi:hypothetical protein [Tranquillimonas rosea]|uniref:hypothetical protein n=1 Tax=Tranquillimonas rosea TaxID=641238 RepID=UPI003BADB185
MNVSKIVKDAVGQVAPTVAGALGGPLAGRVVREVSQAVTGRPDAPDARLRAAVQDMGKAELDSLAALESEYTARLEIAAKDRADARARHKGALFPMVLAGVIIAGFFAVLGTLMFVAPPTGMREVLIALIGLLGGAVSSVTQFYFGSSQGSKDKTALMAGGK